jgi:hypothetical protein
LRRLNEEKKKSAPTPGLPRRACGPIKPQARSIQFTKESGMNPDEPRAKSEDLRRARLAASLRENLKRRKAQSRAREVDARAPDGRGLPTLGERRT